MICCIATGIFIIRDLTGNYMLASVAAAKREQALGAVVQPVKVIATEWTHL